MVGFRRQLPDQSPERKNTWASHSAAVLPGQPAYLGTATPHLDDLNDLLVRGPGVFFFYDRVVRLSAKHVRFSTMHSPLLLSLL